MQRSQLKDRNRLNSVVQSDLGFEARTAGREEAPNLDEGVGRVRLIGAPQSQPTRACRQGRAGGAPGLRTSLRYARFDLDGLVAMIALAELGISIRVLTMALVTPNGRDDDFG